MNKPKKQPTVYAFIDSQNLNLGVQSLGWKLDYRKFRLYLKNKYNASKTYADYDQAIIVSGDGDFYCLAEYLAENDKLARIITPNKRYSKLLSNHRRYIVTLEQLQPKMEYRPKKKPTHAAGRNLRQSRSRSRSGDRSKP